MIDTNWSVPETELLSTIGETIDRERDAVLATVIDVEGSAYRRPGAKMLIEGDSRVGSITAGCLEDEVHSLAADVLDTGRSRIERYDLTGDDDVWGLGVGCNGIITILLEPLDDDFRPVCEASANGEDIGVVTVVGGDRLPGERAYYDRETGFDGDLPEWLCEELVEPTDAAIDRGTADTLTIQTDDGTVDVFIDGIDAPDDLVIFGSGPDVRPVVELAAQVDFRVTVVSFRGAQATEARFPQADAIYSTSPANVRDAIDFDSDTYVVVMSHNFIDDRLTLEELIETPIQYIGLLGPQERFEEILDAFEEEDIHLGEDNLQRLYTPIGLDLGGDSPYQIACSIVAEVLAVSNERTPEHLSAQEGPIHDRFDFNTERS